VVLGGAAALQTLGPSLAFARRVAAALPTLQPWSLPDALPASPLDAARALIGAAILAPSHWNAQPWRFEVDGGELRLVLDETRLSPLDDPDQRFAQMSLGASLENLLVAARAWGQQPEVRYLPWGPSPRPGASLVAATVSWTPGERAHDRALFAAIPSAARTRTASTVARSPRRAAINCSRRSARRCACTGSRIAPTCVRSGSSCMTRSNSCRAIVARRPSGCAGCATPIAMRARTATA
jgi:hypothetical protein